MSSEKKGVKDGVWVDRRDDAAAQERAVLDNAREYKTKIQNILNESGQSLSTENVRAIYFYLDMMRPPSKDHAFNSQKDFVTLSEVISKHTRQARLKEAELENSFDGGVAWTEIRQALQDLYI